jgi:hypothetical protein
MLVLKPCLLEENKKWKILKIWSVFFFVLNLGLSQALELEIIEIYVLKIF